jgi:hypothetical protein
MKMSVKNRNINWYGLFFGFFVAAYTLVILINPQLGPTNDFIFLRTLQSGKLFLPYSQNFPYFDTVKLGRFSPLAVMEYNLFGLFSKSPSPFWYYFYHAIQFVIFAVLIVKLLGKFTTNKFILYGVPTLFFLTPGFTISWFQMQINERNVIFFLAVFLLCYLSYLKEQKAIYFILGLISANLAIYSKEIAFIVIGVFVFSHLLFSRKTANKKIKIFDGLLFLSSLIYIIIYYFFIWLNRGPNLYLPNSSHYFLLLTKNFLNYGFFSDPVLILLLLPLTIWRMYKILVQHQEAHPVYDSMFMAASAYVAAFFVLNMYGPYYLLPAYIFVLPALIYFFNKEIPKKFFWKTVGAVTGFVLIFNVLPSGIHYLTYNKYLPVNFNKTLDFLIQKINSKNSNERTNIFWDGVDRGTGRGAYFVFADFLQFKGLENTQFDLKSDINTQNPAPLISKKELMPFINSFTVFQKDESDEIKSGDYLIVSPHSTKNASKSYLNFLKNDYELVFQTKSPLAFPSLNLKTLVKYFLSKKLSESQKASGVMINENLMNSPDYYVFIKK